MVADHDWPPGLARAIARTVISRLLRDQPIAILEQESCQNDGKVLFRPVRSGLHRVYERAA